MATMEVDVVKTVTLTLTIVEECSVAYDDDGNVYVIRRTESGPVATEIDYVLEEGEEEAESDIIDGAEQTDFV